MLKRLFNKLLLFLAIVGPGLITMEADNDAGAVSSYCQAGAQYGYKLLIILLVLLPITYFCQEMTIRLGIKTRKGLAPLIFETFGKRWGNVVTVGLLIVNFLTLLTEFAAIALSLGAIGLPPSLSIPTTILALGALVASGSYLKWERIMIGLCLLDLTWFYLAFRYTPPLEKGHALLTSFVPSFSHAGRLDTSLIYLLIALIGTTIAPWQLFFQQSCLIDKGLAEDHIRSSRIETFLAAIYTILMGGSMLLIGALAFGKGQFTDVANLANTLLNSHGQAIKNIILLMFVNAAVLGTVAVSLSSAWVYGEINGWPHSLHKKIKDAPLFYLVFFCSILLAGGLTLIPNLPMGPVIVGVQVIAALILPVILYFMQKLCNKDSLLGKWTNNLRGNIITWGITGSLSILCIYLAIASFFNV